MVRFSLPLLSRMWGGSGRAGTRKEKIDLAGGVVGAVRELSDYFRIYGSLRRQIPHGCVNVVLAVLHRGDFVNRVTLRYCSQHAQASDGMSWPGLGVEWRPGH
ncbi:MAG: hypothetical protein Kow00105_01770 [Phycisphaeraceae bacterium]